MKRLVIVAATFALLVGIAAPSAVLVQWGLERWKERQEQLSYDRDAARVQFNIQATSADCPNKFILVQILNGSQRTVEHTAFKIRGRRHGRSSSLLVVGIGRFGSDEANSDWIIEPQQKMDFEINACNALNPVRIIGDDGYIDVTNLSNIELRADEVQVRFAEKE